MRIQNITGAAFVLEIEQHYGESHPAFGIGPEDCYVEVETDRDERFIRAMREGGWAVDEAPEDEATDEAEQT